MQQLTTALSTCSVCGYEVNIREDKGRPEGGNARREFIPGGTRRAAASWQGKGSSYRPRRDESSYSSRNGRFRGDRDFREPRDYRAERPDRRKSR